MPLPAPGELKAWLSRMPDAGAPSAALGWSICVVTAVAWGVIHLAVFRDAVMPLTYALPLLICVWTKDKRMLWGMTAAFAVFATLKVWWVIPEEELSPFQDWAVYLSQLLNIGVAGVVVHSIINLRRRLERKHAALAGLNGQLSEANENIARQNEALQKTNSELETSNEELAAREEEISRQNEELQSQSEELAQQNEELRSQGEELEQQTEELSNQSEELQDANEELAQREEMLQTLLSANPALVGEVEVLSRVCEQGLKLLGPDVAGAAVMEAREEMLHVHAHFGVKAGDEAVVRWPLRQSFARLVMEENRTASLDDLSLRPDLKFPQPVEGRSFGSILAAPLSVGGRPIGAVEFFSSQSRAWTEDQFRLARWVAAQCSSVLEMMRLRVEVQASEAALRGVLDSATESIWLFDGAGTILMANQTALRRLGATRAQAIGKSCRLFLPPALAEARIGRLREVLETGKPLQFEDERAGIIFDHMFYPIRDAGGRVVQVAVFSRDVTQRRRDELVIREDAEKIRVALEAAEAANRAKDQFLAVLSHELRTPLNPALMAATIVEKSPQLPHELREDVEVIRRNVELEARLIDDMLDLTRISRGKLTLNRRIVDGREVLDHAVQTCQADAVEKHLELEVRLPDAPILVDADPARLQQVYWNLLKNAIKFTPDYGRITVSATSGAEGGLRVQVSDTGKGIETEALARIFDAFEQGSSAVTKRYGGLGLGLAICKGLVTMHEGTISAASEGPGRGATFTVELPPPARQQDAAAPEAAVAPAAEGEPSAVGCRILLVEDHESTAKLTARLLRSFGHEVTTADCIRSALERFDAERFDLLVSDLGLPDGSGQELMRRLVVKRPVRGIALSGYGMENDIQESLEAGFTEHLVKPINARQLQDAITRVLGR